MGQKCVKKTYIYIYIYINSNINYSGMVMKLSVWDTETADSLKDPFEGVVVLSSGRVLHPHGRRGPLDFVDTIMNLTCFKELPRVLYISGNTVQVKASAIFIYSLCMVLYSLFVFVHYIWCEVMTEVPALNLPKTSTVASHSAAKFSACCMDLDSLSRTSQD